jgi:hypothetical protein
MNIEFIEDTSVVHQYADGTARFGLKVLLDAEALDLARNGYLCFTGCGEHWENSDIPENTPENFDRLFLGEHDTGSRLDLSEGGAEEARLEQQGWERRIADGLISKGIYIHGF